MKGIAHFVTGVALATFFPEVVQDAAQNLSFGPLLGGLAGLLPDTIDFKFVRYFYRADEEIDLADAAGQGGQPDPQPVAERIAAAMDRAYETGRRVRIQLHTFKLGAGLWRQYSVAFDPAGGQVVVRIGPVVTTGQIPYPDSEIPGLEPGRARVKARILNTYDAETKVDIFSGPSMAFDKLGSTVNVVFLPWHRAWTHSLAMALLLGGVGFLVAPVYGLVMALAVLAHVVEDQVGFMGSNLFFPLTRKRVGGLKWIRSGDALPNFLVVWTSLTVIVLNLDRFSQAPSIPLWPYVWGVLVAPCLLFLGLSAWEGWRARRHSPASWPRFAPAAMAAVEALDEIDDVDI